MSSHISAYILLIVALLALSAIKAQSQDIDICSQTISWHASTAYNNTNEETVDLNSTIVTTPVSISWQQGEEVEEGAEDYVFTITDIACKWNVGKQNGKVVYEIDINGHKGEIKVEKVEDAFHIKLEVYGFDYSNEFEFAVDSYLVTE